MTSSDSRRRCAVVAGAAGQYIPVSKALAAGKPQSYAMDEHTYWAVCARGAVVARPAGAGVACVAGQALRHGAVRAHGVVQARAGRDGVRLLDQASQ